MAEKNQASVTEEINIPVSGSMLRVQIDPERVNEIIAGALLSSGIGDRVKAAAEDWIANPSRNAYNDPVKRAVEEEMKAIVAEVCREDSIRTRLKAKVEEALLNDNLANTIIEALVAKLNGVRF